MSRNAVPRLTSAASAFVALSALSALGAATPMNDLQTGDVVAGVANGSYQIYDNSGALLETLSDGLGGFTTGGSFNTQTQKLYTTNISSSIVVVYDGLHPHNILQTINTGALGGAGCESIVFDAAGNFYVGHAQGDADIKKFAPDGTFLQSYNVATEVVGSDWIDLAVDQQTIFYTSEGSRVMRYDVANDAQLADFAFIPGGGQSFALRLLPPFDGTGGLIVANRVDLKRLDGAGNVAQNYDVAGEDNWFAMNLDPNGTSFWGGDFGTGNFYRFNIASGAIELGPINTGTGTFTLFGLLVVGEITGGTGPGTPVCFGDGSSTPCPCGNSGGPGEGCQTGFSLVEGGPNGSTLSATGSASVSADTVVLTADDVTTQPGLFFQGDQVLDGGDGRIFGDGLRCCGVNAIRLQTVLPVGPEPATISSSITISQHPGQSNLAGTTRCYQYWFRTPGQSLCGAGFNLSNAVTITWLP